MPSTAPASFEYYLANAFTNRPFGGNPALVAFLNPKETSEDILANVAATFKQPMAAFLFKQPFSPSPATERFFVRFFTAEEETPFCGHATVAASKVIFDTQRVGKDVQALEFETKTHGVVTARKVLGPEGQEWIELELAKGDIVEVDDEERSKVSELVDAAFGRSVEIHHVAKGEEPYRHCLMIEVDEKEDIKNSRVDAPALLARGTGYTINAITARSATGKEHFVTRVFVPFDSLGGEDHVCGSVHALLGPYWAKKQAIPDSQEIKATQCSPRGGDLRLLWVNGEPNLRMRGEALVIARGTFSY